MHIKPAALIFLDAAGKLASEAMQPAEAIDRIRAMAKGITPFPRGTVKAWMISGRGIEKECKPDPAQCEAEKESKPTKAKT